MKRMRRLASILLLVAGCGDDPRTARMAPGMTATARGPDGGPVAVYFSEKIESLAVGTRVKVIADREGDPTQARRKVVVGIQDGPSRGLAGQVHRSDLRPGE